MDLGHLQDAIESIEAQEAPMKVILIKLSPEFLDRLIRSSLANYYLFVSATYPDTVQRVLLGKPYEIHEQAEDYKLDIA
ncbi:MULTISPECIES: hypothetical protein [Pseudomonas]|uniref:hypothetical protein n=1 Tax=Pseudomonas TaxID=286 RepID=UPI0006D48D25|nr:MULTISPECIES: hypothetical protein [Pseudomonas]MBP6952998.1 hypothetical protein [Pseudomonas sp.]MDE1529594.1 hypothetical protein [Pseudomonas carnis]